MGTAYGTSCASCDAFQLRKLSNVEGLVLVCINFTNSQTLHLPYLRLGVTWKHLTLLRESVLQLMQLNLKISCKSAT